MKKIFRLFAIICAVTVMTFSFTACSSDETEKVGEVTQKETGENVDDTAEETKVDAVTEVVKEETEEAEAEIKDIYKVGDILSSKGLEIVYVSSGEYVSDNQFMQPNDGNKYIFLELAAENKSDSDKNISYFGFECYADGYQADMFYGNDDTFSATLSPGRSTSGRIVFEVPEDAAEIEVEYEDNFFTDHKIKFAYEGEQSSGYVQEANATATEGAYKVGDVVETKHLKISYLSAEPYDSGNQFITPAEGTEFIACEFEFENISDSDQTVSSLIGFGCFADGAKCEQSYLLDDSLDGTISAGRKLKGKVAFEVPTDAEVVELEYVDNMFTSDRIVFTIR